MKFGFAAKVSFKERLKILWLGGLYIRIEYHGQHKTARIVLDAMHSRDVTGNIVKESENDNNES